MKITGIVNDTVFFELEGKEYKLTVTLDLIIRANPLFIGGSIRSASIAQVLATVERFYHLATATEISLEDFARHVTKSASTSQKTSIGSMLRTHGYTFL